MVLSRLFCPTLYDPADAARQVPLSLGFSRQEHWSGMPYSPPGDLPDPKSEPKSLKSPALAAGFFTTSSTWEAPQEAIRPSEVRSGEAKEAASDREDFWRQRTLDGSL